MNECQSNDWGRGCWNRGFVVAWGLPILAMIVSASTGFGVRLIWPISLAWMGLACLLNARRCGRRHCYFTGPFFLVMALVAGLYGAEALELGPNGWQYIGNITVIGGLLLCCIPELIWGRYRQGPGSGQQLRVRRSSEKGWMP